MRTVTWHLPSGVAAVKVGPLGTVLVDGRLSDDERRAATILAADGEMPLAVISYARVWRAVQQAS